MRLHISDASTGARKRWAAEDLAEWPADGLLPEDQRNANIAP
jgi:hypothetical protein